MTVVESATTTVARREDRPPTLRQQLTPYMPRLLEVAAAGGDAERADYVKRQIVLVGVVAQKNPALARCSVPSIALALYRICMAGLDIGVTAHLVPFKGECTAVFDWKGLVALAIQARHVRDVRARAVYKNDRFVIRQGTHETIEHDRALGNRGPLVAVYAVADLVGNRSTFEVMDRDEVDAIRAKSPSGGRSDSPWATHYDEMAKKTAVKRLLKRMPQNPALTRAITAEDEDLTLSAFDRAALPASAEVSVPRRVAPLAGGDVYAEPAPGPRDVSHLVDEHDLDAENAALDAELADDPDAQADHVYAQAHAITDAERAAFRASRQGSLLPEGAAVERKRGRDALAAG